MVDKLKKLKVGETVRILISRLNKDECEVNQPAVSNNNTNTLVHEERNESEKNNDEEPGFSGV